MPNQFTRSYVLAEETIVTVRFATDLSVAHKMLKRVGFRNCITNNGNSFVFRLLSSYDTLAMGR